MPRDDRLDEVSDLAQERLEALQEILDVLDRVLPPYEEEWEKVGECELTEELFEVVVAEFPDELSSRVDIGDTIQILRRRDA